MNTMSTMHKHNSASGTHLHVRSVSTELAIGAAFFWAFLYGPILFGKMDRVF